jgi:hypothetical protein
MTEHKAGKLNSLERELPEGLLVDARWLTHHGYSTALRSQYVTAGWLDHPTRGVYQRRRGRLTWQQVVVSLQTLLGRKLVVGGRTALELQGYSHYLSHTQTEVHLYGPTPPPGWLATLDLKTRFVYRNSAPLFGDDLDGVEFPGLDEHARTGAATKINMLQDVGLQVTPWGQWDWPLVLSAPERALLELLDELPGRESFHQVDMLMEGLGTLSPRRLQRLLERCRSVKVKRLFFYFAERHPHAWLKRIDRQSVDLGTGKRMLVKGGRFDRVHQITVPRDLYGVQ